MHIGFSSMNNPEDPRPDILAATLEQAGFESLWYGEHSHIPCCRSTPYPGGGEMPAPYRKMMDPYLSLMVAAEATSELKLGTGIALLMERELFSQAKTIATLDHLSNGRVLIGAGVGWNEEEFSNATHQPWKRRFTVLKETVLATRAIWTDDAAEFHGELIDFDPVWADPKPQQPGGPGIHLGVMGPMGLKHAAAWADGWMPADVALPDVVQAVRDFREMVSAAGRDPDAVEITVVAMLDPSADDLKRYRDAGIHRVNVGVGVHNWDKPEIVMPMIERYSKIIPEL